jgi:hypothetical protein
MQGEMPAGISPAAISSRLGGEWPPHCIQDSAATGAVDPQEAPAALVRMREAGVVMTDPGASGAEAQ